MTGSRRGARAKRFAPWPRPIRRFADRGRVCRDGDLPGRPWAIVGPAQAQEPKLAVGTVRALIPPSPAIQLPRPLPWTLRYPVRLYRLQWIVASIRGAGDVALRRMTNPTQRRRVQALVADQRRKGVVQRGALEFVLVQHIHEPPQRELLVARSSVPHRRGGHHSRARLDRQSLRAACVIIDVRRRDADETRVAGHARRHPPLLDQDRPPSPIETGPTPEPG